ncbi:MAG TPA: hypothetical protein VM120_09645 [Bryobacteraceae bacterium]|nr:hypothetical protein [Bryobacteraceae bacterium]
MTWNDAAEDLVQSILSRTPRPVRDQTEATLKALAESIAEDQGLSRVGVQTVVAAWVQSTPDTVRPDLPRQMEQLGLDAADYEHLLN